jgi:hypothetical protein
VRGAQMAAAVLPSRSPRATCACRLGPFSPARRRRSAPTPRPAPRLAARRTPAAVDRRRRRRRLGRRRGRELAASRAVVVRGRVRVRTPSAARRAWRAAATRGPASGCNIWSRRVAARQGVQARGCRGRPATIYRPGTHDRLCS